MASNALCAKASAMWFKRFFVAALPLVLLGAAAAPPPALPICSYQVVQSFPHDRRAFTEGLVYAGGHLFESTGIVGASTIRKVRIADGKIVQSATVPPPYFGEGLTRWKNELFSLTWKEGKGFRWDAATLRKKGEFSYSGEGWGLTHNGKYLILSDGTAVLRFLDPATMKVVKRVTVTARGRPVTQVNELEWVKGEIYANVWHSDLILRIDPATGAVRSAINMAGLGERADAWDSEAVLNGIAYDPAKDRIFVTGKNWSKLFQIKPQGCLPSPNRKPLR